MGQGGRFWFCSLRVRHAWARLRRQQRRRSVLRVQAGRIKGELNVSAYELKDVIHLWDVGKLTEEQAIGQSLLLLQGLQERMEELERRELERGREGESAS